MTDGTRRKDAGESPRPSRLKLKLLFGVFVSALCLWLASRIISIDGVIKALAHFKPGYLAPALGSLAAGYCARIFRWTLLLNTGQSKTGFAKAAPPFLASIALNNVLPMRAGDVLRGVVFPASMGVTRSHSVGTLIVERMIDLQTLALCFVLTSMLFLGVELPESVRRTAFALGGASLALLLFFMASARSAAMVAARISARTTIPIAARAFSVGSGVMSSVADALNVRTAVSVLLISMVVWIAEAGMFLFVALGFGFDFTFPFAVFVMSAATLATLAPSTPGYVGPFHLASLMAATALGLPSDAAGGYAVLTHFVLWAATTSVGAIALAARPELLTAVRASPPRDAGSDGVVRVEA